MDEAVQKQQPAGGNAFSTGLGSPVPPTHTSYAMAAAPHNLNGRNVLLQSATTMPFVSGHLLPEGQHERRVAIGTGSEICAISESALRRDMCPLLQADGAQVRELAEPVSITLFDGQMSSTKKVVTNAKILIGCVQVRVDLFVMPGCTEYLLGAASWRTVTSDSSRTSTVRPSASTNRHARSGTQKPR